MGRLIKHRTIAFIFYYLVGMGVVSFILIHWYRTNIDEYLKEQIRHFNTQIDSYTLMQQKMMDNYYGLFLSDDEMGSIMSQALYSDEKTRNELRQKLMAKTLPMFQSLKNYETRLVFFHLPGQIAFLRLHKPEKFGDSLTNQRPSIVEAQSKQKKLAIFETGKLFDGFRSIYPIFYHDDFVGTVEIAYPFLAIKHQALKQTPGAYTFLIKRSLQESKSSSQVIQQTYQKSPFGTRYYEDKESALQKEMIGFDKDELHQLIMLNRSKIQAALAKEQDQAVVLTYNGKTALMILRSVKELHGKHAAYMVQITPNHPFFESEWNRLLILLFTIAVLYALLLLYIFRYNRSIIILEQYKKAMDENLIVSKTDEKGIITYANEGFVKISGYSQAELIGNSHNIIRHPQMDPSFFKEMWETIRNGKIWYGMIQNRKKTGESYYVNSTICPIMDENGKIIEYIGLREDITDLVEANKREEELRIRAEKSEMAKMEFLANMSHEIRTPLNGIMGFARLLQDAALPSEHHRQATIIVEQGKTLLGVINDILDLSKIESGKMELDPIDINAYFEFENAFSLFIPLAKEKQIDYRIDLDERLSEGIMVDILRLKQVMTNLISNALKFTPAEGSIIVSIKVLHDSPKSQRISFSVADTGIGINPEKLSTIFSPFTQEDSSTTRQYGGTGLGLSISSTLVKAFGGELQVESEKGKGSRFWFEMDVAKGDSSKWLVTGLKGKSIALMASSSEHYRMVKQQLIAFGVSYDEVKEFSSLADQNYFALITFEPNDLKRLSAERQIAIKHTLLIVAGESGLESKGVIVIDSFDRYPFRLYTTLYTLDMKSDSTVDVLTNWSGKRVLIAEDYEVNRILMESLLKAYGIEPEFAETGRVACEMVEQNRYELVLMDINMPDMDGMDATRAIRQFDENLPIVALTANALSDDRERFMGVGMNGYLTKPIVLSELHKVLKEYLGEGSTVTLKPADAPSMYQKVQSSLMLPEEKIRQFFLLFDKTVPEYLEKIDEAVAIQDFEALFTHAHAIKGSAANLQLDAIENYAAQLEEKGTNKEAEGIDTLVKALKTAYQTFHDEMELS